MTTFAGSYVQSLTPVCLKTETENSNITMSFKQLLWFIDREILFSYVSLLAKKNGYIIATDLSWASNFKLGMLAYNYLS